MDGGNHPAQRMVSAAPPPYRLFLSEKKAGTGTGGWVRKLVANKDLVVQEMRRRDPDARPNKQNRTVVEQMKRLKPLTDPRDVEFVVRTEGDFRRSMLRVLEEARRNEAELRRGRAKKRRRTTVNGVDVVDKAAAPPDEPEGLVVLPNGNLTRRASEAAMAAMENYASSRGWRVCVALADAAGHPAAARRLNDAFPASFEMAIAKAKAAAMSGKGTGRPKNNRDDVPRGGLPIVIGGACRGGVGVSGEKPARLEKVAEAGIEALMREADHHHETEEDMEEAEMDMSKSEAEPPETEEYIYGV